MASVILDLLMPGVGDADLAKRIRREIGSDIVLLALTGSVRESDQDAAERSGVDYVPLEPP